MPEPVIKVENLSKQYRIGSREGYKTFRETLVDAAKTPFIGISSLLNRKSKIENRKSPETIWALRDVSFTVNRGEVVGIIGRNGAGKSTLLKILSKITEPTTGRVEMRGRVGSLLEVGTGFHPELTGHENIYLYGAILGMDRWEITRKFDEIVAFAELEKFIDTPVKRYSSGMYMRLAFAVAAHLEPEIMLVDEVLAVGDAAFQKKCLGKMGNISQEGRTVLFVSHNIPAIKALTNQSICIEEGHILTAGATESVVSQYLSLIDNFSLSKAYASKRIQSSTGSDKPLIKSIQILVDDRPTSTLRMGKSAVFKIEISTSEQIRDPEIGLGIDTALGFRVVSLSTRLDLHKIEPLLGEITVFCKPALLPLNQGTYYVKIAISCAFGELISIEKALTFEVIPDDVFGSGQIPTSRQGLIYSAAQWQIHAT